VHKKDFWEGIDGMRKGAKAGDTLVSECGCACVCVCACELAGVFITHRDGAWAQLEEVCAEQNV